MRFGIQPLQFIDVMNLIAGKRLVDFSKFDFPQIRESAIKLFDFPQLCESVIKGGFRVIELTLDIDCILSGYLDEERIKRFIEIKKEEKITYTVHLPLWSIEPASPNEHIRRASVESLVHSIEVAKILEPECYVLHSTGALAAEFTRLNLPENYKELVNRYMLSHSAKSIEEILSKTDIPPRKLALENVEFPFRFTRETVDQFDLSICFDTGHLLAGYSGGYSVMEFLNEHWDRIVEIHLHDGFHRKKNGIVVRRDHLPLGSGDLPVSEFMEHLDKGEFKGPIVFELPFNEAKRSLKTIRRKYPRVAVE